MVPSTDDAIESGLSVAHIRKKKAEAARRTLEAENAALKAEIAALKATARSGGAEVGTDEKTDVLEEPQLPSSEVKDAAAAEAPAQMPDGTSIPLYKPPDAPAQTPDAPEQQRPGSTLPFAAKIIAKSPVSAAPTPPTTHTSTVRRLCMSLDPCCRDVSLQTQCSYPILRTRH